MPQPSYAYGVARVRVLESKLLSKDKLERMLEATSGDDALKVLAETDYAQAAAELKTSHDYEQLLSKEIQKTYQLIDTITPNPELTNCFLLKYDFHNLKVLLKNRYLESEEDDLLMGIGSLSADKLKTAVREKDYRALPRPMKEALEMIDNLFSLKVDPQQIDLILDRAMYDWIFSILEKNKSKFLTGYFQSQVDFINMISFMRTKKLNKERDFLEKVLLPYGKISMNFFLENLEGPVENLVDRFAYSDYGTVVTEGIQSFAKTGRVTRFEKLADDFLLQYVKDRKREPFGIEPIIGYILAKENEIKAIRIIMVGLMNGIATDIIRERLRELYV